MGFGSDGTPGSRRDLESNGTPIKGRAALHLATQQPLTTDGSCEGLPNTCPQAEAVRQGVSTHGQVSGNPSHELSLAGALRSTASD